MDKSKNKERFLELLRRVSREGIENLAMMLETHDFFDAPCSTQFHLAVPGGLCQHSLNVYDSMVSLMDTYVLWDKVPEESVIITALCHDLCKMDTYVPTMKPKKGPNGWTSVPGYDVKDQFPMGHGEKSVSILQDLMYLSEDERLAIRWHMASFDAGIHFQYPSGYAFRAAVEKCPLVTLLYCADNLASNIVEVEK